MSSEPSKMDIPMEAVIVGEVQQPPAPPTTGTTSPVVFADVIKPTPDVEAATENIPIEEQQEEEARHRRRRRLRFLLVTGIVAFIVLHSCCHHHHHHPRPRHLEHRKDPMWGVDPIARPLPSDNEAFISPEFQKTGRELHRAHRWCQDKLRHRKGEMPHPVKEGDAQKPPQTIDEQNVAKLQRLLQRLLRSPVPRSAEGTDAEPQAKCGAPTTSHEKLVQLTTTYNGVSDWAAQLTSEYHDYQLTAAWQEELQEAIRGGAPQSSDDEPNHDTLSVGPEEEDGDEDTFSWLQEDDDAALNDLMPCHNATGACMVVRTDAEPLIMIDDQMEKPLPRRVFNEREEHDEEGPHPHKKKEKKSWRSWLGMGKHRRPHSEEHDEQEQREGPEHPLIKTKKRRHHHHEEEDDHEEGPGHKHHDDKKKHKKGSHSHSHSLSFFSYLFPGHPPKHDHHDHHRMKVNNKKAPSSPRTQYLCLDGSFVRGEDRCDGFEDCPDGSDEALCHTPNYPIADAFADTEAMQRDAELLREQQQQHQQENGAVSTGYAALHTRERTRQVARTLFAASTCNGCACHVSGSLVTSGNPWFDMGISSKMTPEFSDMQPTGKRCHPDMTAAIHIELYKKTGFCRKAICCIRQSDCVRCHHDNVTAHPGKCWEKHEGATLQPGLSANGTA